jgi:hypothetical protein
MIEFVEQDAEAVRDALVHDIVENRTELLPELALHVTPQADLGLAGM